MKIKLKSGEVVNKPLNMAQRLIRLGKASVYIESIPKVVKKAKRKKKAKGEIIENKAIEGQEYSSEEIQDWRNY